MSHDQHMVHLSLVKVSVLCLAQSLVYRTHSCSTLTLITFQTFQCTYCAKTHNVTTLVIFDCCLMSSGRDDEPVRVKPGCSTISTPHRTLSGLSEWAVSEVNINVAWLCLELLPVVIVTPPLRWVVMATGQHATSELRLNYPTEEEWSKGRHDQ